MSFFWPHATFAEDQRHSKAILSKHVIDRGFQTGSVLGLTVGEVLAVVQYRRHQRALKALSSIISTPTTTPTTATATSAATTTTAMTKKAIKPILLRTILNSTGIGALTGATLSALIVPIYMRSKTEIEWQDRAWRLLANTGQVSVDSWSLIGEVLALSTFLLLPFSSLSSLSAAAAASSASKQQQQLKSSGDNILSSLGVTTTTTKGKNSTMSESWLGFSRVARNVVGRNSSRTILPRVIDGAGRAGLGGMVGVLGYMIWTYGIKKQRSSTFDDVGV